MESIKAQVWTFILNNNIRRLPVDFTAFNSATSEFSIIPYSKGKKYIDSSNLRDDANSNKGFSVHDEGVKLIFYKDDLPFSEKNFVIAHEIGHIVLKHGSANKILGKSEDAAKESLQEQEADIFALALLAPAPVLLEIGAISYLEIAQITGLSDDLAKQAALEVMDKKHIESIGLESKVVDLFRETIEFYTERHRRIQVVDPIPVEKEVIVIPAARNRPGRNIITAISFVVVIALSVMIGKSLNNNQLPQQPEIVPTVQVTAPNTVPVPAPAPVVSTDKAEVATDVPDNAELMVYATTSGKKYHLSDCQYVKTKTNLAEMSIKEAAEKGLDACKVCRPNEKK